MGAEASQCEAFPAEDAGVRAQQGSAGAGAVDPAVDAAMLAAEQQPLKPADDGAPVQAAVAESAEAMETMLVKPSPDPTKALSRGRDSIDSDCSTAATSGDEDESDIVPVREDARLAAQRYSDRIWSRCPVAKAKIPPVVSDSIVGIILDWDDTLLPTSFIGDAVKMCRPGGCAAPTLRGHARPRQGSGRGGSSIGLPRDFPCFEALRRHAELVKDLLTKAKAVGHVAIVTLSARPWVFESAEEYLPGLDLPGLLQDLKIPVYYAPEYCRRASHEEGVGAAVACKRNAMSEFLRHACSTGSISDQKNVLSVGDSSIERDAIQIAVQEWEQTTLCKTVKLMNNPSLKQLSDEVEFVTRRLRAMVSHGESFDLCAQRPEDLPISADALFGSYDDEAQGG